MILQIAGSTGIQVFFRYKITAFKGLGKPCRENSFGSLNEKFKNMKKLLFVAMVVCTTTAAHAKIWRVNNNAGVVADFSTISAALSSASVVNGDTIHLEPSATNYGNIALTKQLVIIGNGYLLSGASGNSGLQENTNLSLAGAIQATAAASGAKLLGLTFSSGSSHSFATGTNNITYEKCRFEQFNPNFALTSGQTYSGLSFRKCMFVTLPSFSSFPNATVNNLTIENCVFVSTASSLTIAPGAGSLNFVFRNNTLQTSSITGAYVANNIFLSSTASTFTSCNVKNNLFVANQTGVTVGPLSVNGNNLISQTLGSIILNTGSDDGRFQLAVSSPAIAGGVDISGTKPDCGAFGGTDPYKLSGIPNIPTIYSLTVPASIPVGTSTMNVTLSTRNNN